VQRFPLAELRPFLETAPDFSGHLQADIHVRGTAAAPQIALTLHADALIIAKQPYAGLAVQATYGQERLDLALLLQQDAAHSLTIEGGMPLYLEWAGLRPPALLGEANLRARSEGLSLAFLNLLSKEIREVQGTLSMDVRVHGPLHALVPSGEVQLRQGQVRVIPLGVVFRDMQLQLQLAADVLHITQFTARAGAGQLNGSGTLSLEQYAITAIALTLNADRFRVMNTRQHVVAVSGQLVCSGSLHEPSLRGTLELRDTTLRPDLAFLRSDPVAPDPTIIVVQSEQELAALAPAALPVEEQAVAHLFFPRLDLYRPLALDLTVTVPRNTWVHVPEGSIELIGHLHLRKKPAEELLLSGSIETLRGWYTFHSRRFRIERGLMTFASESPINPRVDVVARYTLPRYQVDVIIGGTAHTPTLSLRSDPQLEEADVLSLLVFGRLASALTEGEKVSLQSQALKTTLGFVVPDLQRSVARQLGVDLFEFEVGETPLESRIGVGKYLTEDIFITTSRRLGEQPEQEFAIEYHIDTTWQLKSSTTSRGSSSIDLFWQKRY
jgi:translocation and assembly module TamB